jgi:hypothetical protein
MADRPWEENMKYIVTHGGRAHRDDFFAVGLAVHIFGELPVFRRNPTEAELDDPEVLVIDTGGQYDPCLSDFDHHQIPSKVMECAFSLMSRFYSADGTSKTFHDLWKDAPWYRGIILQDCLGPNGMAKELGLGEHMPEECVSGIETHCLQEFATTDSGDRILGKWVTFARELVEAKIRISVHFHEEMEKVRINHEIRDAHGTKVFWAPTCSVFAVSPFIRRERLEVGLSVTEDPKNHGLCLYQHDYAIDLAILAGQEDVLFAHNRGFMATVKAGTTWDRIKELIRLAIEPA